MNLHQLTVKNVLSVAQDLLSLTLTGLFGFSLTTLVLSQANHGIDTALLLQADKFLRKRVHGLGNDLGLHSLGHAIHDALLIVVNKHVLFLSGRVSLPFLGGSKLSNKIETFFLALEHHVLLSTAAEKALEQDDGAVLLVALLPLVLVFSPLTLLRVHLTVGLRRLRTKRGLLFLVLLVGSLLGTLLLRGQFDVLMGLFKSTLMVTIFSGKLLAELEPDLVDTYHGVENLRLLDGKNIVKLLQTLIAGQSLRLDFVLVGLLVQRQAITSDWSVYGRTKVSVFLDNIAALGVDFDTLARFVHLSENLDSLTLNLCQSALFVFSFLETDFLSALSMLLFKITLTLDEGRLKKIEALILNALDFLLTRVPLTMFLLLHESAAQSKASLIRGGRQRILESLVLAHLLDQVHLNHGSRETTAELVVSDIEHFGNVLRVDRVLGRVGVGLGFGFSEDGLNLRSLGPRLLNRDLGRLNALLRDLHHTEQG